MTASSRYRVIIILDAVADMVMPAEDQNGRVRMSRSDSIEYGLPGGCFEARWHVAYKHAAFSASSRDRANCQLTSNLEPRR